jgi:DNA recombination protein RmuC
VNLGDGANGLPQLLILGGVLAGIVAALIVMQPRVARLREKLVVAESRLEARALADEERDAA